MRFDVVYNGKRTTARLSDEMWELFIAAFRNDRLRAISEVETFFKEKEQKRQTMDRDFAITASHSLRAFVTGFLKSEIRASAGFNPGNSRARCPDTGDLLEAAEAKPATD